MPRRCTVCDHPKRAEVDRSPVARRASFRNIAERFQLALGSLSRHYAEHLPQTLSKAADAEEAARADDLLGEMQKLQRVTLGILARAANAGDLCTALGAIRETKGNLELLAKLAGELEQTTHVNILVSPEWAQVRTVILGVLGEAAPELRAEMARVLMGPEAAA